MYKAGISYDRFGRLTMREINYIANAYSEKIKSELEHEDAICHLQGAYMVEALMCTVGNMFSKGKKIEYPKEPYSVTHKEPTEEEKQKQIELFFAQLDVLGKNFNAEKKRKEKENEEKIESKGVDN